MLARAESECFVRTNSDTGGFLSFFESMCAEGAFHHTRFEGFAIFVSRDLERAGNHTIAAADTFPSVVVDGTEFVFLERADDTGGCASRAIAVHALNLHRVGFGGLWIFEFVDDGVSIVDGATMLEENGFVFERFQIGACEFVFIVACPLAFAATDANDGIDEDTVGLFAIDQISVVACFEITADGSSGSDGRQLEEVSACETHLRSPLFFPISIRRIWRECETFHKTRRYFSQFLNYS